MIRHLPGQGWYGLASRFGLLLLLPVMAGCGPGQGTVLGKVTYRGRAVPGYIMFRPADSRQNPVTAVIDENGHYEARVPAGEAAVSIDNREWNRNPADSKPPRGGLPPGLPPIKLPTPPAEAPKAPAAPATNVPQKQPGAYVPIPPKYYTVEQSGLKCNVTKGNQQKDFDLTD